MSLVKALPSPLVNAPNEVILRISDFLSTKDLNSFLRTTARFANLLTSHLYDLAISHICKDGKTTTFEWAVKEGRENVLKKLQVPRRSKQIPTLSKNKALCVAAEKGHRSMIKPLIDMGADVSALVSMDRNEDDADDNDFYFEMCTALQCAAEKGHVEVALSLLEMGADPSATDDRGKTALLYATWNGHVSMIELLLAHGADIEAADPYRHQTALHWAVYNGQDGLVRLLLRLGANVSAADELGHTSLHYAADFGHEGIVRLLLEHHVDVSATTRYGETALDYAVSSHKEGIINILKEKGCCYGESRERINNDNETDGNGFDDWMFEEEELGDEETDRNDT